MSTRPYRKLTHSDDHTDSSNSVEITNLISLDNINKNNLNKTDNLNSNNNLVIDSEIINNTNSDTVHKNNSYSNNNKSDTIWIFGYGSLCWKPDFDYINKLTGFVRGYSRKFWQGNTAHRGTPGKPGRVATLIEEKNGEVWGVGYEVSKNSTVLDYLWNRECVLGGYHLIKVKFHPIGRESVDCLAYLATPSSPGWLGEASVVDIALQVSQTSGPAGHNSEYICKLATWIRSNTPSRDQHLDLLDLLIRTAMSAINDNDVVPREEVEATLKRIQTKSGKRYEHAASRYQA